jgi:hypothetical protein
MCLLAVSKGLRQVILPYPIWHQNHTYSGQVMGIRTDFCEIMEKGKQMIESRKPEIINGENWGLGEHELKETKV